MDHEFDYIGSLKLPHAKTICTPRYELRGRCIHITTTRDHSEWLIDPDYEVGPETLSKFGWEC